MDQRLSDVFELESQTLRASRARGRAPEVAERGLRNFSLILARCQSSATLLSWRADITAGQKRRLDAAILRLQQAAVDVAIRPAPGPSSGPRRRRVPSLRASLRAPLSALRTPLA